MDKIAIYKKVVDVFRVFTLLILLTALNYCFATTASKKVPMLNVVTEDWPPHNFLDSHGEIVGTSTKKIKSILHLANINYNIELLPWARAFNIAVNKPNTLIYSIYRIKERESLFHWFCPLSPVDNLYAYALKESAVSISSVNELKTHTFAVSRNEIEHTYLSSLDLKEGINLHISAEDETSFDHVLNNKVELFIETPKAMELRLKKRGLANDFVVPVFKLELDELQHCFAISKGTAPEVIKRVSKAFEAVKNTEEVDIIEVN